MNVFIRKHLNYVVGFFLWILSITFVIAAPKLNLFKKKCSSCEEYSRFVSALSSTQKEKLVLWEASVIRLDNEYFYIGEDTQSEFDLYKNNRIQYKILNPIIDEKTKRSILVSSILRTMNVEDRDDVINHKAAIVFRNNEFVFLSMKDGFRTK